ncbi:MAG: hypothetical protein MZV70_17085 [Desulfobacterales bacterium]|nr:hypothetical protein [Desulfobacterales bacterium]
MTKQQSIGAVMADMTARCTSCGDCVRACAFLQRQGHTCGHCRPRRHG